MENILKVILENENLKEELKVLLVKHGYYKEARYLRDFKSLNIIDIEKIKTPKELSPAEIEIFKNNLTNIM